MAPTTIQVNITRDSQDRTSEEDEEEVEAIKWINIQMKPFTLWYADYFFSTENVLLELCMRLKPTIINITLQHIKSVSPRHRISSWISK